MTRQSTNTVKAATHAHPTRNADHPIGLGYPDIMEKIEIGLSWKEDAKALDRRIEDATRSFGGAGNSSKCQDLLAGE